MLRNVIYYWLKPFVPRAIRMAIRRHLAQRKREQVGAVWPIMPGSELPPQGWTGWPEGKKFAFVLTHDVEGQAGVDRCRRLAELEMEYGFRSSFNFIPEGDYSVPAELRNWLTENGFEVGVHDLKHDGWLYRSYGEFKKKSARINQYIKEWGAAGFRSGFMLNNLNWLHELDIQYDASTFDTDPFEPQPEGRHTIFPFWIPSPNRATPNSEPGTRNSELRTRNPELGTPSLERASDGYVELPYTLPQDSTLFLLLGEKTPQIWLNKLDWIASHGGMGLVDIHPDYVCFEGDQPTRSNYPAANYRQLLQYVSGQHGGSYWQPLPKEVAAFVAPPQALPSVHKAWSAPAISWTPGGIRKGERDEREPMFRTENAEVSVNMGTQSGCKHIGMVTHSFYESDVRVMRYAEALAARGDRVDVFALRRSADLPKEEVINGVHLFRIQDRFGKTERSKLAYLLPLVRFLWNSSLQVTRMHSQRRYDLLHIHNIPDFVVFSAWYPKLTGARIILDVHDIVPEFFASKFGIAPKGVVFTLLCWMERLSAAFADHVIIANHLWLGKYSARTHTEKRCTAFINNVDSNVFVPQPRSRSDEKLIVLFPGGLQWHQGVDIAIRAFKTVVSQIPNAEFHIYGDGNARESLETLALELGLADKVLFFKPMGVRQIATIMAHADLGVVPKRADSFGDEAYSTKIMEFMSVGVPVVVSSTKVDRYYFDDSVVRFFESGNTDALAREMIELLSRPDLRRQIAARALEYAALNCWESRKGTYLDLVNSLAPAGNSSVAETGLENHASPAPHAGESASFQ